MNQHDQSHLPASYPSTATQNSAYVVAPPPIGYPTKDDHNKERVPVETKSRGDGFLKGCLAGLCCCCCLDVCF